MLQTTNLRVTKTTSTLHVVLFILFFIILTISDSFELTAQPTLEWVARYARTGSIVEPQMSLDKIGNTYVLGYSSGGLILIKYTSNGDTVWTRRYTIVNNVVVNCGIVSDSIGNVYITGYQGPSFGPYDIITIKYNDSGVQQWVSIYSGEGGVTDTPSDILLDKYDNPYVTGGSGMNALLIKYNNNTGDTLIVKKFSVSGYSIRGIDVRLDTLNNIYIGATRRNTSTNAYGYQAIKCDSNGTVVWANSYTSIGFEVPYKMAIDRFGNCYMAGDGSIGALTLKFNANGSLGWYREYPNARFYDIVTDTAGNCYVTGYKNYGGGNSDYIAIKYNIMGDTQWVRLYHSDVNGGEVAYSIAIDDSANIYLTGSSIGNGTNYDYATVKYNINGVQQWVVRYNGSSGNTEDDAYVILLDKQRNIYVTGISDRGGLLFDYTTIKYSQPPVGIVNIGLEESKTSYLSNNFPNPFNSKTKISYEIHEQCITEIILFDINGKYLKHLIKNIHNPGKYLIDYQDNNLSSGIYFYVLKTNEKIIDAKKMVIVK